MRKWITFLMTVLAGSTFSHADANLGQLNFEAGYRQDSISWSNHFPSSDPVVSTKHKFEDIEIFQIGLQGRTTIGCNFYVRGSAYWGWVLDGNFKNEASTYGSFGGSSFGSGQCNKTLIDDRYVFGVGAAVGYPFFFCDCTMAIAPVIGYSFDQQTLRAENGGIGFDDSGYYGYGPNGDGGCCRRTFTNRWYGPFVGLDFVYRPYCTCWDIFAELEYHWGNFKGKRSHREAFDFGDSSQDRRSNDVRGWVFACGADYDIDECWTAGFSLKFQDWKAHKKHHNHGSYGSDSYGSSSSEISGHAKHNHKWHSYAINLTVGRQF